MFQVIHWRPAHILYVLQLYYPLTSYSQQLLLSSLNFLVDFTTNYPKVSPLSALKQKGCDKTWLFDPGTWTWSCHESLHHACHFSAILREKRELALMEKTDNVVAAGVCSHPVLVWRQQGVTMSLLWHVVQESLTCWFTVWYQSQAIYCLRARHSGETSRWLGWGLTSCVIDKKNLVPSYSLDFVVF